MSLLGRGVLAIWNGIAGGAEDEFLKWHVHEHIPERVVLPGFLRGRRYAAIDGEPRFFNFYETETLADLSSEAYRAELDRPSPWTQRVVRHFTDTSRTPCEAVLTMGRGEGAVIETIRLSSALPPGEFIARLEEGLLRPAAARPKIVGAHLLEGQARPAETAENRLRGGPDEAADWIVLIEAVEPGAIEALRRDIASDARLTAQGALADFRRGAYALQFSLSKTELPAAAGRTAGRGKWQDVS